jgi:pyridoxal phosphate enzyme (YggS family)
MSIADHLHDIHQRIAEAAQAVGRAPESVQLIAVSKTKPITLIEEALAAGQLDFGENRVQELREKQPLLPQAHWHMIGSLQRNKVKYIAPFVHLIHSVDSERLLAEIDKQARKIERVIDCLLQLNISEEEAKSGLDEVSGADLLRRLDQYPNVRILGLMGMAAFTDDMALVRSQFARLRRASGSFGTIQHPRLEMRELSMGMSGDFEVAIAEGATMVRIGSAVFGSRH